jgi:hypothetical protein
MAGPDGGVDGGVAVLVLGLDVSAVGNQKLNDRHVSGDTERSNEYICFHACMHANIHTYT